MREAIFKIGCLIGGIFAAFLISGCTTSEPYWTKLAAVPGRHGNLDAPIAPEPNRHCLAPTQACIAIVEFDDYGNAMNRAQLLGAVKEAEAAAKKGATVLVYMHGWHENARRGAPDLNSFLELVQRASRIATENRAGSVFGIYVGWRGDSIAVRAASAAHPEKDSTAATALPSYALTFWDRKAAAQRIGASGGVYELIRRLSAVRETYPESRLVFHGHSFGGALLYSAVSSTLVDQIMQDGIPGNGEPKRSSKPVADLVVLVNPAFEAMRLRPQFDLARSYEYPNGDASGGFLPPRLVVITSEADTATRIAFSAGRVLGTLTDAYSDDAGRSRAENTTAVGHHIPLITHQLTPITDGSVCPSLERLALHESSLCIAPQGQINSAMMLQLTRCDKAGDCEEVAGKDHFIARGAVANGLVPFRLPIMNIRTVKPIIGNHTDIWQPTFQNFLAQLAALAVRSPAQIPAFPR
ncbi:hypothetical protein [Variovorax paradoxus]|uniref:hypothetical protein n=1 Tax=Variovorax paradoxus TaxID=34073 RepID=UPI000AAF8072|nr:hypothetical protein [Variovorax paradoxus]